MTDDAAAAMDGANSYEARRSGRRSGAGPQVEVQVRQVRRRNWSVEDKLRIVRETLEPGTVAKAVADRHGISTGLLFTWRKELLTTAMSGFVPVQVVPDPPRLAAPAPAAERLVEAPGTIEAVFPSGATVRVSGQVDAALLRDVLVELGKR